MRAARWPAIALLTCVATIVVISSAAGQPLEHQDSTVIFDYRVTNDYGIHFADEFARLGGVETLGYPASYRFRRDDGFVYQVTQGALLQWRPEVRRAYLGNTFEMLEKAGFDPWLLDTKGIPLPIKDDGSDGNWEKAKQTRLSWLTNDAIKTKFLGNPNPDQIRNWSEDRAIELYGLPMSFPERHGPFITQRFQRVAFQLWVEQVEGMPAVGTVVRVLGGDLLKETCLVPAHALAPADRQSCPSRPVVIPRLILTAPTLVDIRKAFELPLLSISPLQPPPQQPGSSDPPPPPPPPKQQGSMGSSPQSNVPKSDPPPPPPPPPQATQVSDPLTEDEGTTQQPGTSDPAEPAITISGLGTTISGGETAAFTVSAADLDSSETYTVQVTTSNANVGFNGGCTDRQEDATVSAGDTSHSSTLTLHACSAGAAVVTATLLKDGTSVDTATHSLTVTTPPPPPPPPPPPIPTTGPNGETLEIDGLPSSLLEEEYDSFWVYAENLDSGTTYVIRVTASNTNIGFSSDCSDQQNEKSVSAGATRDRLLTLVEACTPPGGTVTASLVVDGNAIAAVTQYLTVEPDLSPKIELDMAFSIYSVGAGHSASSVSATKLDSSKSYRILLTMEDNEPGDRIGISFDGGCSQQEEAVAVPAGSTSYSGSFNVEACDATSGSVTAELQLVGGTEDNPTYTKVTSAAERVIVTGSVRPRLYGPDSVTRGQTAEIGYTLDSLDSASTYTVVFETSNGIGFNSSCTDNSKRIALIGKTSYSVTADDFAGKDEIYGCTAGSGSLTAKVYGGDHTGSSQLPANAHRTSSKTVNVRDP